jgi:hypothetical protein
VENDARKSESDVTASARSSPGGEKDVLQRWQNPTLSPVRTGFQPSIGAREEKKEGFPLDIAPGTV